MASVNSNSTPMQRFMVQCFPTADWRGPIEFLSVFETHRAVEAVAPPKCDLPSATKVAKQLCAPVRVMKTPIDVAIGGIIDSWQDILRT
jgi:hypothetical protein